MLNACKKSLLAVMIVFLSLAMMAVSAFGNFITLDAVDDAGQAPGQSSYVQFMFNSGGSANVTTSDVAKQWTSAQQVFDYATSKGYSEWSLTSGGNIWSNDYIVGESLTGLDAGIYRITPLGGAYQYDSFGWGSDADQQWRWEMHIQAINTGQPTDYMLGLSTPFDTPQEAFAAVSGTYLDINILEGGSLHFWIWETNSIDNSGSLSANVTAVPAPPAMLLLGFGLLAVTGFRKLIRQNRIANSSAIYMA
jgi:hypothetical protein